MSEFNNTIHVFMVTHNIKCTDYEKYILPIQAGSYFFKGCKCYLESIRDDIGINISHKNKEYSELTALYWIWKNYNNEGIVGLCHYRRKFNINESYIKYIMNNYDIILPYPKLFRISLKEQYIMEHGSYEWKLMIGILKEKYYDYYLSSNYVFNNNKMYCYNMFIAKKNFISKYCQWLFPILFELERRLKSNIKKDPYQRRYIGFIAERLLNLYIYHNKMSIFECKLLVSHGCKKDSEIKNVINNIIFNIK